MSFILSLRRWLAGAAGLAVALHAGPADAAPHDDYAEYIEAAAFAHSQGDPAQAADLYLDAYNALPETDRGSETATDVVFESLRLQKDRFFADPTDAAPLRDAQDLLIRHITDVQTHAPNRNAQQLRDQRRSIEALLKQLEPPPTPAVQPGPANVASTPAVHPPTSQAEDRGRTSAAAVALATVGGVTLAGGAGLTAWGGSQFAITKRRAEQRLDTAPEQCADDPNVVDRCEVEDWRDRENAKSTAIVVSGAVLMAAGIGMAIGGTILFVRNKRKGTLALRPANLPGGGMVVLSGEF